MKRLYHFIFVGLVSLLTVILLSFLLLFADVGFSQMGRNDHLAADAGNTWTARRLRLSAEMAYNNYWKDPSNTFSQDVKHERFAAESNQKNVELYQSNSPRTLRNEERNVSGSASTLQPLSELQRGETVIYYDNTRVIEHEPGANGTHNIIKKIMSTEQGNKSSNATHNTVITGAADIDSTTSLFKVPQEPSEMVVSEEERIEDEDIDTYTGEEEKFDVVEDEKREAEIIEKALKSGLEDHKTAQDLQHFIHMTNDTRQSLIHLPNVISPLLKERSTDPHFHMPCPQVYRPTHEILMASWMKPLLQILSSFEGKQVTLVIANNAYRDVLLNWLISAHIVSHPPLENIVVVCLDHNLYHLLQSRGIPSIVAQYSSVLNTQHRFRRYFELIMMMRLGFMRLINRLGYDCAMYDIDAIILKNPQPLYEKWKDADIVGSKGALPRDLWRKWGVTICIGAVFIRSNPRTELYWEAVYSARVRGAGMANDQIRLNYGLQKLHVQWDHDKNENQQHDIPALGHSSSNDLSAVVVPFNMMCRFGCRANSRDKYYIWHKGGSRDKRSKMKGAKQGGTWFLKERWSELHSNLLVGVTGTKWLRRISTHT